MPVRGKDALVRELPSEALWQRLREEAQCRAADLRRARRLVRKLARDLPAFDTVWIDALVQCGRLTPYQARLLESDPPEPMRYGEFVLLDELGRGSRSRTWLARRSPQEPVCVLKRITLAPGEVDSVSRQAELLLDRARALEHPALTCPREHLVAQDHLLVISPFVEGSPLSELLVRRGRFPSEVVIILAQQLVSGLMVAHQAGLIHGSLRRSHVRVRPEGQAVLVETGLQTLFPTEITVHAPLALEAYDGIAPELIGVGRSATPASDWYALGCLLWELLAGRPPFPTADPLAKLAAHQTRLVDDVREQAPDTPEPLALLVRGLTHRDPEQRQLSAAAFLEQTGSPTRRSQRLVARFRRSYDLTVPHLRTSRQTDRWFWVGACIVGCLLAGALITLSDTDFRAELLALPGRWSQTVTTSAEALTSQTAWADLKPLPPPTPEGVIWLTEPGPYAAATIRFPGTVSLQAAEGICAEILIRDQPLRIAAEHWKCERVRFRCDRLYRGAAPAPRLVEVVAQRVTWQDCLLDLGERGRRAPANRDVVGVLWQRPAEDVPSAVPRFQVRHSVFHGAGAMLQLDLPSAEVHADNVLHLGRGPFLACREIALHVNLDRVTLRNSGPLLQCQGSEARSRTRLRVWAERSLLQLAPGNTVLEITSPTRPHITTDMLNWRGDDSWLAAHVSLLSWVDLATGERHTWPSEEFEVEGLAVGDAQFAGLPTLAPADSAVVSGDFPRQIPQWPGIEADLFGPCRPASADR